MAKGTLKGVDRPKWLKDVRAMVRRALVDLDSVVIDGQSVLPGTVSGQFLDAARIVDKNTGRKKT
jgi:hypothetical protein